MMAGMQCYHENKRMVWTSINNDGQPTHGPAQLRFQCLNCGRLLAGAIPHAKARADTPQVDEEALRAWIKRDRDWWSQARKEADERSQERLAEQSEQHRQYLQTEAWAAKRELVMQRAHGMCEGCGVNKASQVHHLTYVHQGNEFLWELVAVCRSCHERAHGIAE